MSRKYILYRYIHPDYPWLYVGQTTNPLGRRDREHKYGKNDNIDRRYVNLILESQLYYVELPDHTKLDILEKFLIDKYKPFLCKKDKTDNPLNFDLTIQLHWIKFVEKDGNKTDMIDIQTFKTLQNRCDLLQNINTNLKNQINDLIKIKTFSLSDLEVSNERKSIKLNNRFPLLFLDDVIEYYRYCHGGDVCFKSTIKLMDGDFYNVSIQRNVYKVTLGSTQIDFLKLDNWLNCSAADQITLNNFSICGFYPTTLSYFQEIASYYKTEKVNNFERIQLLRHDVFTNGVSVDKIIQDRQYGYYITSIKNQKYEVYFTEEGIFSIDIDCNNEKGDYHYYAMQSNGVQIAFPYISSVDEFDSICRIDESENTQYNKELLLEILFNKELTYKSMKNLRDIDEATNKMQNAIIKYNKAVEDYKNILKQMA